MFSLLTLLTCPRAVIILDSESSLRKNFAEGYKTQPTTHSIGSCHNSPVNRLVESQKGNTKLEAKLKSSLPFQQVTTTTNLLLKL